MHKNLEEIMKSVLPYGICNLKHSLNAMGIANTNLAFGAVRGESHIDFRTQCVIMTLAGGRGRVH